MVKKLDKAAQLQTKIPSSDVNEVRLMSVNITLDQKDNFDILKTSLLPKGIQTINTQYGNGQVAYECVATATKK